MDDTGQVFNYAKKTIRSFYNEAADIDSSDIRDAVLKHAKRSESIARIKAMVDLAQHMVPAHVDDLDADKWLLNVNNGVLDLKTGELLPHDHSRLITKLAPVDYDPKAECPRFKQFLGEVFPDGDNVIPFLQRLFGYCLTGETSEQKMAIAWGNGANGKSTLINILLDMLGDYGEMTPTETFMAKRNEGIPNDIARLRGARMVLASEAQEGRRLNEPLVKQVTGQDKLTARFLRQEFFSFTPSFKLVLLTNHKPLARGDDGALWRRIMLVPFTQKFEGAARDNSLPDKLRAELPGILKWAVDGCLEWQKNGLNPPTEVLQATAEYQNENDIMSLWMDECCVKGQFAASKTSDLYHNFINWINFLILSYL
jgi:putative DNA primase/helicase